VFQVLLVIAVITAIFCLCVIIAGLFAVFFKNGLPDVEDLEVGEQE
jgi:hypothetical protein